MTAPTNSPSIQGIILLVTNYACEIGKFVLNKSGSVYFYLLVATCTGYLMMLPGEPEGRPVVIEIVDLPLVRAMAAHTIG